MTSSHPRLEVNEVDDTATEKVPSTPGLMINRLAGSARLIDGSHVRPAASYMPLHHHLFFCLPCHSPAARVRVQLKQCPGLDIKKYPKPRFILIDMARQYPWIITLYLISQAPPWSLVKSLSRRGQSVPSPLSSSSSDFRRGAARSGCIHTGKSPRLLCSTTYTEANKRHYELGETRRTACRQTRHHTSSSDTQNPMIKE